MKYVDREISSQLKKAQKSFPIICLTGPRQTGKSTLLKKIFPKYDYITLDDLVIRQMAVNDPALFIENLEKKTIIDEIQYAPELLPYLKMHIDNNRRVKGQFIITGSQVFNLMEGVTESLAGRVVIFELLSFSSSELSMTKKVTSNNLYKQIFQGFYPDPSVHNVPLRMYYSSYIQTYLERDIQQITSVHDILLFQKFIGLLASRVGGLLNVSEIAKECGINHSTGQRWLSLLERTRIIYLLRPYYKNISKRIIKAPKLYFTDTGLLSYILKYPDHKTLMAGPMQGHVFENFVVIEFLKNKINFQKQYEMYHYRDSNKNEIDLVLDHGGSIDLIEIKSAKTIQKVHYGTLEKTNLSKNQSKMLVSCYDKKVKLTTNITNIPWWSIAHHLR